MPSSVDRERLVHGCKLNHFLPPLLLAVTLASGHSGAQSFSTLGKGVPEKGSVELCYKQHVNASMTLSD